MESFYHKLLEAEQGEKQAVICIVTKIHGSAPGKPGMKMLVYEDGSITGTVGGGAIEKDVIDKALSMMQTSTPLYFSFNLKTDLNMDCGGGADVYIEPVNQKKKLYIFGGGHIGKALSEFAFTLGFDVIVIDEREGIFNDYKNEKLLLINKHFTEVIHDIKFDKKSYFVIVTHKHIHDADILKLLCNKTSAYLGMIGSRTKVEKIIKDLVDHNYLTEEASKLIDSPIGIKFKAITPNEIAISILAKLIDVRNSL
ncbi:MAG: XdhC family protein [Bacteroidales bacterium]|nr:XdhC family protein [Bacteroidales bacterium]